MKNVFVASVLLLLSVTGMAQAGAPDPAFGTKGIVKMEVGGKVNGLYEAVRKTFVQRDGKLLLVVQDYNRVFLTRRLPDGRLDSSYANNGFSDAISFQDCKAAIQSDGKVLLVASSNYIFLNTPLDFKMVRINEQGQLDSSFGANGIVTTDFGFEADVPTAIAIQKDDKIVVAGNASHNRIEDGAFALARYNADGSLDSSFDKDGKLITDYGGHMVGAVLTLNNTGKILLGGTLMENGAYTGFTLAQFNTDGTPDSTFGQAGKIISSSPIGNATNIATDHDNNIIVGGSSYSTPISCIFKVVRYKSDGSLDNTFYFNGTAGADFGHIINTAYDMAIQPDNKIVLGGYTNDLDSFGRFAVARFNTDGTLDESFNGNGKATCTFERYNEGYIYAVAVQPDAKVIVAGFARTQTAQDLAMVRYNSNGSLDASFGAAGKVVDFYAVNSTSANQFFVQNDGKPLVYTAVFNGDSIESVLTRYTADGAVDNSFAEKGRLALKGNLANIKGLQPDGSIVTGSYTNNYKELAFYRFHPDGTIDPTYGQNGKAIIESDQFKNVLASEVVKDNKLLIISSIYSNSTYNSIYTIERFTSQGTLDASFGNNGKIILPTQAYLLRVQADGKFITGGYKDATTYTQYCIRRYLADGSIDATYGQDGIVDIDFPASDLAFQQNGDLLVSSSTGTYPDLSISITRITTRGQVDSTFGNKGNVYTSGHLLAIQDNDAIITVGAKKNYYGSFKTILSRLKSNGIVDSTFGTQGFLETELDSKRDNYPSQVIAYRNRLYVLGNSDYLGVYGWLLAFQLDAPTVKCPTDTVVYTDLNSCAARVNEIDPVATTLVRYKLTGATQGEGVGTASGQTFNKGITYVTYSLQQDSSKSGTFSVTVKDTSAPVISNIVTSTAKLWQPDHKMKDVILAYTVSDNCSIADTKISITSNEPDRSSEPYDQAHDWEVVDAHHIRLRAERSSTGTGRVYTITITGTDVSGNTATQSVTVSVPKSVSGDSLQQQIQVFGSPNPSRNSFLLLVESKSNEEITIHVLNSAGKVIETRKAGPFQAIPFGNSYRPGLYYIEVIQGSKKTTTTLLKAAQ